MNKIIRGIKNIISNPRKIFIYLNIFGLLNFLSDKNYQKLLYWAYFGNKLDLDNPKGFNEKLHWLMVNDRNPLYTSLVDKYEVRDFIKERIGEEYLIPLINVYRSPEEINLDKLPDNFVLKCNNNSGVGMCICKDKSKLNYDLVKEKLSKGLKSNGYSVAREWPYKNVKPLIVCEEYMQDELSRSYGVEGLLDYKFYCFNGNPKFLYVSITKEDKSMALDYYDLDFKKVPFYRADHEGLPFEMKKPKCFEEMKEVATKLSKDIPFVRVDLYQINEKVYFSELTFYPGAGYAIFSPKEWEKKLGDWLRLTARK